MCSSPNADVDDGAGQELFYRDVRHLSRWLLRVDGRVLDAMTSRRVDYFSSRVVGKPEASDGDRPALTVRRDRFVSEGVHEDVVVENLSREPRTVEVELSFAADFADVMEAQEEGGGQGKLWQEPAPRSVTLWSDRDGYRRGTVLTFNRKGRVGKERATFTPTLAPGERWSPCVDMTPVAHGRRWPPLLHCGAFHEHASKMPLSLDEWLEAAPALESDNDALERTYRQSLLDLAALRIRPDELTIRWAMPAGGLPWFMTVFGRDSLIAAYQAMPFHPELAKATLEALAELQAEEWDSWRDAEPGKILHELRRGALAETGRIPHTPYYGSHDSTMLWLIALDEYERWTGDTAFVRRLEANVRAALAWLEGPADLDGDGYVEYRKRSTSDKALDNHCWRDSDDSILFADGRPAQPPIAVADQQGYAYDARLRAARLLRQVWNDEETAERLEAAAAELKEHFDRDFWSRSRRHYVLALDAEKRQVDSLTSDIGHLLWSGIVEQRRIRPTARRLMRPDLYSGWGIRSMSASETGYHPLAYHGGTVWPHDTALVAEGLRRYGFRDEAATLGKALLDAAEAFGNQLPEVFAGFARDETGMPVEYPDALKPQSWAAGAPLLVLRTLLGLDAVDGKLRCVPHLPPDLRVLRLRGLRFRGRLVDLP
ncbi:MAG TPA: glycogen debranching N-terminal domain-containing protein [Gaiellaceae bacterium]